MNPWFDRLTMIVILINCITLGMYRPCEDGGECTTYRCYVLSLIDHTIFAYFALEMVLLFGTSIFNLIGKTGSNKSPVVWGALVLHSLLYFCIPGEFVSEVANPLPTCSLIDSPTELDHYISQPKNSQSWRRMLSSDCYPLRMKQVGQKCAATEGRNRAIWIIGIIAQWEKNLYSIGEPNRASEDDMLSRRQQFVYFIPCNDVRVLKCWLTWNFGLDFICKFHIQMLTTVYVVCHLLN